MFAEDLKRGSLINGQRVVGLRTGIMNGRRYVRAILADDTMTEPLFYGRRVPGSMVKQSGIPATPVRGGGFCIKDRLIGPNRRGESDEMRNRRLFGGRMARFAEAV